MADSADGVSAPGRPILLGCVAVVAVAVFLVAGVVFFVGFLESGSSTGEVVLRDARSYAPGSVARVAERGFFIVRLGDGSYLALVDLDAANRAASDRRCKVAQVPLDDPALVGILERYGARRAPDATALALVFRETCNGALYDAAGTRLDRDDRNLDRYDVSVNDEGLLVVNTARRSCSERTPDEVLVEVEC